jgi:hypothetical protein
VSENILHVRTYCMECQDAECMVSAKIQSK